MGQLFFDIAALTDHYLGQERKSLPQDVNVEFGFENVLKLTVVNDKLRQQQQEVTEEDFVFSLLSNIPAVGFDLDDSSAYAPGEVFQPGIRNRYAGSQAEVFTPELMTVGELESMVKNQNITLSLDLSKSANPLILQTGEELKFNNPIENKNISIIPDQDENPDTAFQPVQNPKISSANEKVLGLLKTDFQYSDSNNYSTDNQKLTQDKNLNFSRLIFSANRLFDDSSQTVPVKAIDKADNIVDLKIPVSKLKDLIKNYPDKIIIEVKSFSDSQNKFPDRNSILNQKQVNQNISEPQIRNGQNNEQSNRHLIFDLKSLLTEDTSKKIKAVQKVLNSDVRLTDNLKYQPAKIEAHSSIQDRQAVDYNTGNKPVFDFPVDKNYLLKFKTEQSGISEIKSDHAFKPETQIPMKQPDITENSQKNKTNKSSDDQVTDNKTDSGKRQPVVIKKVTAGEQLFDNVSIKNQTSIKAQNVKTEFAAEGEISAEQSALKAVDQAEKIIDQLKAKLIINPEKVHLTIKLKPESLGKITVDFKYDGKKIEALFRVENPEVKFVLDSEMPKLKSLWKIDDYRVEINNSQNNSGSANSNQYLFQRANHRSFEQNNTISKDEINIKPIEENKISQTANIYGGMVDLVV